MDREIDGNKAVTECNNEISRREVKYFFADFIKRNIAFCYIWLPLALTIWGYFFDINRPLFVAGGHFVFAASVIMMCRQNTLCLRKKRIGWFFAAYGLLIIASITMFSRNPLISSWFLFAYVVLPFAIGAMLGNQVSLRSISLHFSLLMIICIFVLGENVLRGDGQRAFIFGSQANSVQLSLVCAFVFSFVFAGALNKRKRFSIVLIFILLSGFVSGSILPRWFSLASVLILFVSMYSSKNFRSGTMSVLAFIAGWLIALLCLDGRAGFYFENLVPRVAAIDGGYNFPITSIEERIRLYFVGIELLLRNPILGVGVGNFGYASGGSLNSFPHLSMLHIASELGVFVLVFYLIVTGYAAILLARASEVNSSHLPWFLIFLYGIVFSLLHGNYLTDKLIYISLGYASSLVAISKEGLQNPPPVEIASAMK